MPGLELVGAHRACPGIFHLSLTTAGCFNLWSPTEGKAELHLRQLSLKYKQAILQDDLLQRSKFSIVLLGACVLHVPTAQWPVEERNLILTPPCWCWCCSRDSFTSGQNAIFDCPLQQRRFICDIWYGVRPALRLLGSTSKIVALQL